MGYSIEFKNKVVSRILSDEISVVDACREYKVSKTALYEWLKQVSRSVSDKGSLRGRDSKQSIPLPRGMNLREALIAEGHCQILGMDSPEAGKFCRSKGITLEELKEFSEWCSNSNGDVALEDKLHTREKELSMAVTSLSAENRAKDKELRRKDKALAEAAALLVLSKKAQAIWGDKDE